MNISDTGNRFKAGLAALIVAVCMSAGSANALLDDDTIFAVFIDDDRNGNRASFVLDLNTSTLDGGPSVLPDVTSPELANWLADPQAGPISWAVYAVGNDSTAENFFIWSTVNPAEDTMPPDPASQNTIDGTQGEARDLIGEVNGGIGSDSGLARQQGEAGFPQGFGDSWGGRRPLGYASGIVGEDAMLRFYLFGIENQSPFAPQVTDPNLFAVLDAGLGNVSFAAVPVPAAVWLLGSALLGLIGVRRRHSTV